MKTTFLRVLWFLSTSCVAFWACVTAQAQDSFTNGLVAYYPFNGNANDASGNGNNGTVNGATLTTDRFGQANSAYYFNGVSSDILLPETFFGPTDAAWTVSVWIALDSWPSSSQNAYHKSCVNGEMGIGVTPNQTITFGIHSSSGDWLVAQAPLHTNTAIHVVGVYRKGQSISLYVNGVLADNLAVPNVNLFVTSFPLISALGSYHYSYGPYAWFRGTIDDFRVYTRALSASEVQQLFLHEAACPAPLITSQPRDQVGYWGKGATFSVTAAGAAPLAYQWQRNSVPIAGGTGASLVLTNLQASDAGNYSVVVTNDCGTNTSSTAHLTMNPAGVSLALYSGITIEGVVGLTYGVQYSTDLSDTKGWRGLANVTLSVPTMLWFDLQAANQPQRYYRVVPGPIPIP